MSDDTQAPESTHALPERLETEDKAFFKVGRERWEAGVWPDDGSVDVFANVHGPTKQAAISGAAELVRRWNAETDRDADVRELVEALRLLTDASAEAVTVLASDWTEGGQPCPVMRQAGWDAAERLAPIVGACEDLLANPEHGERPMSTEDGGLDRREDYLPSVVIEAYRRIVKAADSGRGVRLSAEECWEIANMDDAIRAAIASDDELRESGSVEGDGRP